MTKTVYLLGFQAQVDWNALPDGSTVKIVAEALREAADELEEYADWKPGGMFNFEPMEIEGQTKAIEEVDTAIRAKVKADFGIKYLEIGDLKWTDRDFTVVDFPEWALCHLVNGDPLETAEDINDFGAWERRMVEQGYAMNDFEVLDDRNEFCANPAFGLAGSTTKVRFFKDREE